MTFRSTHTMPFHVLSSEVRVPRVLVCAETERQVESSHFPGITTLSVRADALPLHTDPTIDLAYFEGSLELVEAFRRSPHSVGIPVILRTKSYPSDEVLLRLAPLDIVLLTEPDRLLRQRITLWAENRFLLRRNQRLIDNERSLRASGSMVYSSPLTTTERDRLLSRIHPHDQDKVRSTWADDSDTGLFELEYRVVNPDGSRWVLDQGRIQRSNDGFPPTIEGIRYDITLRKGIEAELLRTDEQLRHRMAEIESLMDVVPVGVFVAHDRDCRRITGNRAAYQLLRMSVSKNMSKTAPFEEAPNHFKVCQNGREMAPEELPVQYAAQNGVEVRNLEWDIHFDDGTVTHVMGSATPLFDMNGEVRGVVAAIVDISARKRLEEELREADQRKDEFLAMLAHELRNPLAPIRNATHILGRPGLTGEQAGRARAVLERQVEHLVRLVDDLLDVSRILRGKVELRMEIFDLREAIRRGVETAQPLFDARDQRLQVALPAEGIPVNGDPVRLTQVVANLLTNAAKFTPNGGSIALRLSRQRHHALIEVQDTGQGIPADLLPRIFDLFVQGDRSAARTQGGLGIGLTLVRSLSEMHGGTVSVESPGEGLGSRFLVQLPLHRQGDSGSTSGGTEDDMTAGSGRVLIVDDNQDAVESLAFLLEAEGYEVRTAGDGPSALAIVETYTPTAVILDIGLPGMNGHEVARQLRARPTTRDVLMICLSGYGQENDRKQSEEAGFDHHFVKPVDPGKLLAVLGQRLAG